jgi:uncharacterized protein (DUF1697 family)
VTSYVALLKGINVGGHRRIAMADLKRALTEAGFDDVRTLLASGNVVLETPRADPAVLEARLASETASRLGVTTDYMVRDAAAWATIIAANPFPDVAAREPGRLLVVVMQTKPDEAKVLAYLDGYDGPERVSIVDREIFIHYPDGQGQSRLSIARFGNGTARNWNTVLKLATMVEHA